MIINNKSIPNSTVKKHKMYFIYHEIMQQPPPPPAGSCQRFGSLLGSMANASAVSSVVVIILFEPVGCLLRVWVV